jgi:hypothetical protein
VFLFNLKIRVCGRGEDDDAVLAFFCPIVELPLEDLDGIDLDAEAAFEVMAIFTATDIAVQAIEGTTAIEIKGIIVQKPAVSLFLAIEYGFNFYFFGHICGGLISVLLTLTGF